ncbi:hypothetical protein A2U01_0106715, partial [Trifolium medium]|nr:hypothetical protein [Trifolium medium]
FFSKAQRAADRAIRAAEAATQPPPPPQPPQHQHEPPHHIPQHGQSEYELGIVAYNYNTVVMMD